MQAVAERIAGRSQGITVMCAYLEIGVPDLDQATAEMLQSGVRQISIVPLFLGSGKHVREDVPRLVSALLRKHIGVQIALKPAIGEDVRVLDLLADIAMEGPEL
jgi:sirohydrochlorin cobaltochelatase